MVAKFPKKRLKSIKVWKKDMRIKQIKMTVVNKTLLKTTVFNKMPIKMTVINKTIQMIQKKVIKAVASGPRVADQAREKSSYNCDSKQNQLDQTKNKKTTTSRETKTKREMQRKFKRCSLGKNS